MVSPLPVIRATDLRWWVACPRRLWLDRHRDSGLRDAITPVHAYRLETGVQHENAVNRATASRIEPVPVATWAEGVEVTRKLIRQAERAILGAYLEAELHFDGLSQSIKVVGRADRLHFDRHRVYRSQTYPAYIPIEIKTYDTLSAADELQLDCYLWLLTRAQEVEPMYGEFWLGKDYAGRPLHRIRHEYDETRLFEALRQIALLVTEETPEPAICIKPHCRDCHWYSACRTAAEARFDVTMLSGLRQDTLAHFQQTSITTLDQLVSFQPDELRQFKGIKSTAESIHAHARAWLEGSPVWYNRLPEVCRESGWFFDIETRPDTGEMWCIGWSDAVGRVQVALVSPDHRRAQPLELSDGSIITVVPDADAAWLTFAEGVAGTTPVYHWTGFDAGVMRKSAPPEVVIQLNDRLHDLHRTFNQVVKFPIDGSSLKTVAAHLGFSWSVYQAWNEAWLDYQRWLLDHSNIAALSQACAYQADDVIALRLVWDWLAVNHPD